MITTVFTNGCFDGLHEGHKKLIKECCTYGERVDLIIAINSDSSIKYLKSTNRPFNTLNDRIKVLENFLDQLVEDNKLYSFYIREFDSEDELRDLVTTYKPKYLVKGSDYKEKVITGSEYLSTWGGEIKYVDLLKGYSTTKLNDLKDKVFLITGALGFIGSNFIKFLNKQGIKKIICIDILDDSDKWKKLLDCEYLNLSPHQKLFETLGLDNFNQFKGVNYIIHLGANSNTQETDLQKLYVNNTKLTNDLILLAQTLKIPMIYASSAATYGSEETDFTERTTNIKPINKYGFSKLLSDKALDNVLQVFPNLKIYGLRFFNVYGPGEDHKIGMESGVTRMYNQDKQYEDIARHLLEFNKEKYGSKENWPEDVWKQYQDSTSYNFNLFSSYREDIPNGEQKRDFIHMEDVCKVMFHLILNLPPGGIYNVGSGKATSFNEVCKAINPERKISYIEMPHTLKPIYQYYTCADLTRLREVVGYTQPFLSIEEGIKLYTSSEK